MQRMGNEKKACRDISALSPVAQRACRAFLRECEKEGLPVLITETYRSQARQDYLYAQGRTRTGKVVTWTRNSRHTGRMAWDICKNVKGQEYTDAAFFAKCGAIAKRLGITWGGTWDTPDKPHFEVTKDWKGKGDEEVVKYYETLDEVPTWAKSLVQDMIAKGCFADADKLHLSDDMLRTMALMERYVKEKLS